MWLRIATALVFIGLSSNTLADKWIVLGDSISAGYGMDVEESWVTLFDQRLNEQLDGEHTVVNASISGETTGGGLARLPNLLDNHADADWIIVELGGNDGLRGYPIGTMRDNLRQIIEISQDKGLKVILVGMQIPPNYGTRYTRQFRASYDEISAEYEVPLVEVFLENVAFEENLMQDDGIHPTAEAQPILLDNVWSVVATVMLTSANDDA
ncbi:MAG: arylesterase [Gammaproteobacteria bacterium]|nr:arylesterase [Gammaproteobacteria bacterium]